MFWGRVYILFLCDKIRGWLIELWIFLNELCVIRYLKILIMVSCENIVFKKIINNGLENNFIDLFWFFWDGSCD